MKYLEKKLPVRINLCEQPLPFPDGEISTGTIDATAFSREGHASVRETLTLQLETIPDAVIITAQDGTFNDLNQPAATMINLAGVDTLPANIKNYLPGLSSPVFQRIVQSLHNGRAVLLEGMVKTTTGEEIPSDISVSLCGKDNKEICFILRDMEHHRRTEEALNRMHGRMAKAERLETAGTVSGQIAHDFNNLLTPMMAYPSLIRRELAGDSPALEYLDVLEKTAEDMTHMTQQLLALSRRGNVGDEIFNLNDVAQHVFSLLRSDDLPDTIELESNLADDLLPIRGGSDQMLRVVHNLCQNAIDALEKGGKLSVKSENIYLESPVGHYESVEPGEYVRIAISDNGPGIDAKIRGQVFEPFFTTKRGNKRRGSGLGLSIVHGIINDHHGYVDLDSNRGSGTTFYLYLPVCRQMENKSTVERDLQGHGERVLVLDDDPQQLRVVVDLCKALNYEATGVTHAEETLHTLEQSKQNYNLVILDMRLEEQEMDGCDTWCAIAKKWPHLPSLLVSGFGYPVPRIELAQRHGAGPYLKKPLTLKTLGQSIQKLLCRQQHESGASPSTGKSAVSSKRSRSQAGSDDSKRRDEPSPGKAPATPSGGVLLVEDEERIRKMFSMVIEAELPHVRLDQAANGKEALQAFQRQPYDVIVMDLHMPVMDGRQAFIELRRYCLDHHIKMPSVIFCTGFSVPKFLKQIVDDENEPHILLLKPVRNADLVQTIRQRLPNP